MNSKRKNSAAFYSAGRLFPALLLICGISLFIFGISRGELDVILERSVRICLECIGIG